MTITLPLEGDALRTTEQGLFDATKLLPRGTTPAIPVLIVPHHLTAAVTIAAGLQALIPKHPSSILLLSPDHFHACSSLLCTGNIRFETPFGTTNPDPRTQSLLRSSPLVGDNPHLFENEHGITALIPFIQKLLPETLVTPVVIAQRPDWKGQEASLLELLKNTTASGTAFVVSSDFSHYLPLQLADAADEKTALALFSDDTKALENLANPSQSDCPTCLWLAANIASVDDAFNPSVLLHTNSARILKEEKVQSTTSHFAIAFYRNADLPSEDVTFGGDVTLTRSPSVSALAPPQSARKFWSGKGARVANLEGPLAEQCASNTNPFIFCNPLALWISIKSIATIWNIENNHKLDQGQEGFRNTIELLKRSGSEALSDKGITVENIRIFALTNIINPVAAANSADLQGQYRRVLEALRAGSGSAPQVVYVHSGTEYEALSSASQEKYLRSFVDSGARAVIAVHSHVIGDMEMYRGAPIFRGVGNFIFDQYDQTATKTAKLVRLSFTATQTFFQTMIGH